MEKVAQGRWAETHTACSPERHGKPKAVTLRHKKNGQVKWHRRRKNETPKKVSCMANLERMRAVQMNFPGMDAGSWK